MVLSAPPPSGALDLSGIPLAARDMERLCGHLQRHSTTMLSLELGFTELTDEAFLLLLPTLAGLPHLETLALNGNRLTRAVLKELTDALKDPGSFPSVTWIDLGNNVDIFSLPQPFLVSLRKRCPKQGNLPTILEFGESQASEPPERPKRRVAGEQGGRPRGAEEEEEEEGATDDDTNRTESMDELRSEVEEEMDGELEIEEMMEELLDFDREVRGPDEVEEDSMWTLEEPGRGGRAGEGRRRRRARAGGEEEEEGHKEAEGEEKEKGGGHRRKKALKADDEDDTQSRSSRLSCSSQSQHSSGVVEPMRVEADDPGDATKRSDRLT
ncbi:Leucine-rich repeat-containing protein 75A [Merluccius polli]|uniref:Leucine-rich repeat-containing protein 75A n=1 Tax=Merluccius polli TaxID=89951 RepID=A0AA47MBP4_MERPO|nr:Leucine-rich repeat-containing protein 75A [Merluccius polli]